MIFPPLESCENQVEDVKTFCNLSAIKREELPGTVFLSNPKGQLFYRRWVRLFRHGPSWRCALLSHDRGADPGIRRAALSPLAAYTRPLSLCVEPLAVKHWLSAGLQVLRECVGAGVASPPPGWGLRSAARAGAGQPCKLRRRCAPGLAGGGTPTLPARLPSCPGGLREHLRRAFFSFLTGGR